MSFFGSILEKLGIGSASAAAAAAAAAAPTAAAPTAAAPPTPATAAVSVVDVVAKLDGLAASNPHLNWKTSIVDLLKLLGLDSSLDARKKLANELNVHAGADGSAQENIALHKAVLQKIAENGGNIPKDLL